jgi:hypothetical protein
MNSTSLESPLEPLARAVYAVELAGLSIEEVEAQVLEAAEQGQAFSLSFQLPGQTRLNLAFEPTAGCFELAVHLAGGYAREEVVLAALRLNHELASRSRRFSLEPYSGDVVLSEVLTWDEAESQELALAICDLVLLMGELEDLGPLSLAEPLPEPMSDPMLAAAMRA